MVDLLYTCHCRAEFVKVTLQNLMDNTNWELVESFYVYMDCSGEEPLSHIIANLRIPIDEGRKVHFLITNHGSIVAIMKDWIDKTTAPLLAKIDSDTMVPPGWLDVCVETLKVFPRVDLLGIEAYGDLAKTHFTGLPPNPKIFHKHGIRLTDHVGGIGVFHRRVFETMKDLEPQGTFHGFTEWQWRNPSVVKVWLDPALPVFLLDHLPFDPWKTLTDEYIAKGWMRRTWGQYEEGCKLWDWWKP